MTNAEYIKSKLTDMDLVRAIEGTFLPGDNSVIMEAWIVFDAWVGKKENRTNEVNYLNWLNLKFDKENWKKVLTEM